mgnify:CR=1 FL=1
MIFSQKEFDLRIKKVKDSMSKLGIDILISTDPSNMNYLTGYDGWSFYVPQGVIVSADENQPFWFGRKQDSKGARITTFLNHDNIYGYPEKLIQSPPLHPYDFVVQLIKEKNCKICCTRKTIPNMRVIQTSTLSLFTSATAVAHILATSK